jgi:hypothetical protein
LIYKSKNSFLKQRVVVLRDDRRRPRHRKDTRERGHLWCKLRFHTPADDDDRRQRAEISDLRRRILRGKSALTRGAGVNQRQTEYRVRKYRRYCGGAEKYAALAER